MFFFVCFCFFGVIYSIPSTQGVGHRKRFSTSEGSHAGSRVEFQKYAKDTGMDTVWIWDLFYFQPNTGFENDGGLND